MPNLQIYGPPPSSYVRTTRMTLAEKGVDYTLEPVEFGSDEHRALHPYAKVPILRHGDVHLYETQAIVRYIDAEFDGPSLIPSNNADMARMEQWISVNNCYLYGNIITQYCFNYIRPKGENGQPDMAAVEASLPQVEHDFGLLDRNLEGKDWLAGTFSLADLMVAPVISTASLFPEGGKILDRAANVRRWLTAIEGRDSGRFLYPPKQG